MIVDPPIRLTLATGPPTPSGFALPSFTLPFFLTASTTAALYFILTHLLRNGELLAAEKSRLAKEEAAKLAERKELAKPRVAGEALEVRTSSDIELLAVAPHAIITWSILDSHLNLHELPCLQRTEVKSSRIPLPFSQNKTAVAHIALSTDALYCAVADMDGQISVWDIEQSCKVDLASSSSAVGSTPLAWLVAASDLDRSQAPPTSNTTSIDSAFYAARTDGSLARLDYTAHTTTIVVPPMYDAIGAISMIKLPDFASQPFTISFARIASTGSMEVWSRHRNRLDWHMVAKIETLLKPNLVTSIAFVDAKLADVARPIVLVGTTEGSALMWDVETGDRIAELEPMSGPTLQIRSLPASPMRYLDASDTLCDCFTLLLGTATTLHIRKILLPPSGTRISSYSALSMPRSPSRTLASSPSHLSDDSLAAYPLSPHSLRRGIQANDKRKAEGSEDLTDALRPPTSTEGEPPPYPKWYFDLRVAELGSVTIDARGVWDVCGSFATGISRNAGRGNSSPLDGWQVWSIDLTSLDASRGSGGQLIPLCLPLAGPLDQPALDRPSSTANGIYRRQRRADPLAVPGHVRPRSLPVETRQSDVKPTQLAFARIRLFVASPGRTYIATGLGNAVGILTKVGQAVRDVDNSDENSRLLAFLVPRKVS